MLILEKSYKCFLILVGVVSIYKVYRKECISEMSVEGIPSSQHTTQLLHITYYTIMLYNVQENVQIRPSTMS